MEKINPLNFLLFILFIDFIIIIFVFSATVRNFDVKFNIFTSLHLKVPLFSTVRRCSNRLFPALGCCNSEGALKSESAYWTAYWLSVVILVISCPVWPFQIY